MTSLQEALDLLRSDDCTAEDWGRLFREYQLTVDDEAMKAMLQHPLVQLDRLNMRLNDAIHFEWLGQNPIWPLLYETNDPEVERLVDHNENLLVYAVIAAARGRTRSNKKFIEKASNAIERWKSYLESNFEIEPEAENDSYIYFDMIQAGFRELPSDFSDEDIDSLQENIDSYVDSYVLESVASRKVALFKFAFLLEKEFKFAHRGHLMSFLEES